MYKKLIIILLPLILSSCWPCKITPILIENGNLPDSILSYIPYQHDSVYKFQHSNGLTLSFKTERENYDEYTSCDHCCDYEYHYEVNRTDLTTDYPLFDISFWLDNQDTSYYYCLLSVGNSGFTIPISDSEFKTTNYCDSLSINSDVYYEVIKLESNSGNYYSKDSIYIDSLFYNTSFGILKILMSNKESYEIVP